jgi:chemotaxis protein MotB
VTMRRKFISLGSNDPVAQAPSGGWQLIYTGFVLIMLSFFIMLTSFASLQKAKVTRFAHAFSSAVRVFQGGKSLENGDTANEADINLVAAEDQVARLFERVSSLSERQQLNGVGIERSRRGVVMTLSDTMLFDSGSAELSQIAYPLLEKIGGIIAGVSVPVEIEGHTDNMPIRTGRFPSNWELSTARAINVLRFFIDRNRADARRISAAGRSEYQPLCTNDTAENRARNRRVEIIFKVD